MKFSNPLVSIIAATGIGQSKKVLDPEEFEKAISDKQGILLDVRSPEEFQGSHISGSININWQDHSLFANEAVKLDKAKPLYVYCLAGVRSEKAAEWLDKAGFRNVVGLDGGIKAWIGAGKAVV